jgi:hypothetical protein
MDRTYICMFIIAIASCLVIPSLSMGLSSSSATLSASGIMEYSSLNVFYIHGADTGVNIFNPNALNYHANAGTLLKDSLGMNVVRLQMGSEGDIWRINMVNNAANDAWADHLESLLATIDSMGLKCYFYTLGCPWGGELGIKDPIYGQTPMEINLAKTYIDKLAGDNKLNHNFITDPRILVWSVGNEATIATAASTTSITLNSNGNWIIQMCDYIRSKGGKTVVPSPYVDTRAIDGNSINKDFRWSEPLLRGHVDYLEAHIYGVWELVNHHSLGNQQYDWSGWKTEMQGILQNSMINTRGTFSIDQLILGEWGMWRGTGSDAGLNNWYFSDANRRDFYTYYFQAIESVGLRNTCFHYSVEEEDGNGGFATGMNWGAIDFNGQAYPYVVDIIRQNHALL